MKNGTRLLLSFFILTCMVACSGSHFATKNVAPSGLRVMKSMAFDGTTDDLVTAGVGQTALLGTAAIPTYADPANPTAAELRRAAIARRYDKASGEGVYYGGNIDPVTLTQVPGEGKIAGREFLAYNDDGSGKKNVAMLLQVPDSFDVDSPCVLVVAVPSAFRIYTAIETGAWGLRRNCAAVYTDKGGGNGIHELSSDTVLRIDGTNADPNVIGIDSHYTSDLVGTRRTDYLAQYPNRVSVKPYGKRNTFAEWGSDVVAAAKFAIYQLNEIYGETLQDGKKSARFTKGNTLVILRGNSSGGGAAMMGAEADKEGWIDGVVVAQPQVQPKADDRVTVRRGGRDIKSRGMTVIEHLTLTSSFMNCAAMADPAAPGYSMVANGANVCASLKDKGLLTGSKLAEQAMEARRFLFDIGFDPDGAPYLPINAAANPLPPAHSIASAFGRLGVEDNLCDFTVSLTVDSNGKPSAPSQQQKATMWVTGGGYAPQLIYENSVSGAVAFRRGISPSTGRQDYSLDGALCLRNMMTGTSEMARRIQEGAKGVLANGDVHGKPMIVIHGREDSRVPATLTSRMWMGLNSLVEGAASRVRYIEITNTSHVGSPLLKSRVVPLAYYEQQALNMMWDHLKKGTPLPKHQVVRTIPRGTKSDGSAPDLSLKNVPPILMDPASADAVSVSNGLVIIPD